jgi:hypothetical protein
MFCRRTGIKISKEDVIPDWIAGKQIHGIAPDFLAQSGSYGQAHLPIEYRTKDSFGWKVKGPCKPCNEGWMSTLEVAVEPLLTPLMEGRAQHLDREAQKTIAVWAFKTALMWDWKVAPQKQRRPSFTQAERTALFRRLEIPFQTHILVSRYAATTSTLMVGGPLFLPRPSGRVARISVITIAIHNIAFQITSLRLAYKSTEPMAVLVPENDWPHFEKRLWPFQGYGQFPPLPSLDKNGLLAWTERWRNLRYGRRSDLLQDTPPS